MNVCSLHHLARSISLYMAGLCALTLLVPCAALGAEHSALSSPSAHEEQEMSPVLPAPLESTLPDIALPPLDEAALGLWDAKQRALLAAARTMRQTLARAGQEDGLKASRKQALATAEAEMSELRRLQAFYTAIPLKYGVLDDTFFLYTATAEQLYRNVAGTVPYENPASLNLELRQQRDTLAVLAAKLARALEAEDIRAYGRKHGHDYQWHHRRVVHAASELGLVLSRTRAVRGTDDFTDEDIRAFQSRAALFEEACVDFDAYASAKGKAGLAKEAASPLPPELLRALRSSVKALSEDFAGGLHMPHNPMRRYFEAGVSSIIEMATKLRHRGLLTAFSPMDHTLQNPDLDERPAAANLDELAHKSRVIRHMLLAAEKTEYFIQIYSEQPRYRNTLPPFLYVRESLPQLRQLMAQSGRVFKDPADDASLAVLRSVETLDALVAGRSTVYASADGLISLNGEEDEAAHAAIRSAAADFARAYEQLSSRLALLEATLLLEDLRAVQKTHGLCYYLLHFKVLVSAKAVVALLPTDNSTPVNVAALDAAFADFDKSAAALDTYFKKNGQAALAAEVRHPITPDDCSLFAHQALTALESARLGLAKVYNGPVFFTHEAFRDLCRKAAQTRFAGPKGVLTQLPGCGDAR